MSRTNSNQHQQQQGPAPLAVDLIDQVKTWYYKNPERNQKGGFTNFIVRKAGDFDRICFQATAQEGEPRCVAPFGVSEPYDATKTDSNKRNFELNIKSQNLMQFLRALDDHTLQMAIQNAEVWFGGDDSKKKKTKPPSESDVRSFYRSIIQEGDEEKGYDPIFRTKVIIEGQNKLRVYIYEGLINGKPSCRRGTLADVTSFVECVPIVEVVGMWFMSKQFGLSLTTTDVVLFPKAKRAPGLFNFGGAIPEIVTGTSAMDIVPTEEAASSSNTRTVTIDSSSASTMSSPGGPGSGTIRTSPPPAPSSSGQGPTQMEQDQNPEESGGEEEEEDGQE